MTKVSINQGSLDDILYHLETCNNYFIPQLDSYVNIEDYAKKIYEKSIRFECYNNNSLIGLLAVYTNPEFAYITNCSVDPKFLGQGISNQLMDYFISQFSVKITKLEVNSMNLRAIKFYKKYKFNIVETKGSTYIMQRDYNQETEDTADHNYSYGFDFDVMHPYIIQTFAPFFKGNNVLELGSYKGNFTSHLTKYFSDVTCIEASDQAAKLSKARVPNANVICSTFEDSSLDRQFDNVILTHVLEHIDDRVGLLRKIATTWLTDNGRLFVVCPNADAISRQIAVKMGLMDSTTSVTESEFKHGHRVTYNFESLEKDILESGLRVAHKTGIFLKPLANFQMDRVIEQEIVSKQYLDGCYSLGFEFPNLCASIFFLCEKP